MKKTYILAVSGGVDSVVLLDKLAKVRPPNVVYIVAHFDHGIRKDSRNDAAFVGDLAKKYGLDFETERAELGEHASESVARDTRYDFLYRLLRKYKAEALITAHHQDDVLETMIANMLRGTGPKGLVGFTRPQIIRPFLNSTKAELLEYAKKHDLIWHEDSTNEDERYLRNYVRRNILSKFDQSARDALLAHRSEIERVYLEIDALTKKVLVQLMHKQCLQRSSFVVLPYNVQREVVATWLRLNGILVDKKIVERAVIAIKTAQIHKHIDLQSGSYLIITPKGAQLEEKIKTEVAN